MKYDLNTLDQMISGYEVSLGVRVDEIYSYIAACKRMKDDGERHFCDLGEFLSRRLPELSELIGKLKLLRQMKLKVIGSEENDDGHGRGLADVSDAAEKNAR